MWKKIIVAKDLTYGKIYYIAFRQEYVFKEALNYW